MNTKKCIYRNCGNVSTSAPKLTFFSFPLKDVAKCKLWSTMAGCENQSLKQQYLCENHFNTIYVSKTPRRAVLLPNAVPYQWSDSINGDDNDDEYNAEKSEMTTAREENLLEPLIDDDPMIYSDEDQRQLHQHQSIEILDDDAIVDDGDEHDDNQLNAMKTAAATAKTKTIKIGEPIGLANYVGKETIIVQQHRMSLPNSGGSEFVNHVTKRQKMNNQLPSVEQQQRKVRVVDSKKSIHLVDEKHVLNNGKRRISSNSDHIVCNVSDGGDTFNAAAGSIANSAEPIDDTIKNPNVATFFLNGEEYIQMPKRIYLEQRAQVDADLTRYRTIIDNMKNVLNSID